MKRYLIRVWARRNLILRLTTLAALAMAMANSVMGFSFMISNRESETIPWLLGGVMLLAACLTLVLGGFAMRREWNYNFIPNVRIPVAVQSREDCERRAKEIATLCRNKGIPINIQSNLMRDEMVLGFLNEDDAVLIRMSI